MQKRQHSELQRRKAEREMGLIASFMPKPLSYRTGSGMHMHMSVGDLKGKKKNLFTDDGDKRKLGLSPLAYHFLGGIMARDDDRVTRAREDAVGCQTRKLHG